MPIPPPYAIVLDDHPLVGRGMAQYLQSILPELTAWAVTAWDDVPALIQANGCPRLLVADVWLAEGNSLKSLTRWREQCPDTPWLAISGDDDPSIPQRVRQAGAHGFVHKQAPPAVFGEAFTAVLAGGEWFDPVVAPNATGHRSREWLVTPAELGLTLRQGEILALVLRGLPNKRIASALGISESTVKEHVTGILERLGVHSRVEAITKL
ncbi:MAG TPA: response regulator transcription factor, partial [Hydrogenophaga sp.]|nr:response regulator transcription factor [Hydrogenophaga sp.]